jgi:hypothetical protein
LRHCDNALRHCGNVLRHCGGMLRHSGDHFGYCGYCGYCGDAAHPCGECVSSGDAQMPTSATPLRGCIVALGNAIVTLRDDFTALRAETAHCDMARERRKAACDLLEVAGACCRVALR